MVELFIDGSCQGNGTLRARGGYAVTDGAGREISSGRVPGKQTNNRAEIMALIGALDYIKDTREETTVYTDSRLVYDSIKGIAKRRANRDLWEQIEEKAQDLHGLWNIQFVDRSFNVADALAKTAARSLISF